MGDAHWTAKRGVLPWEFMDKYKSAAAEGTTTFAEMWKEYVDERSASLSPNTLDDYWWDLARLFQWWGWARPVIELTREHLLAYFAENEMSQGRRFRVMSALRSVIRVSAMRGLPGVPSPDVVLKVRAVAHRGVPRHAEREEIEALFDAVTGDRDPSIPGRRSADGYRPNRVMVRALLELLYACGLRIGEALDLHVDDVLLEDGVVILKAERTKGRADRVVPFGGECARWLALYMERVRLRGCRKEPDVPYLFLRGTERLTVSWVLRIMAHAKALLRARGIKVHRGFHYLRHSFASHMVQNGADIIYVQMLLGHANIGTTQVYTHVMLPALRETYMRAFPRAYRKGAKDAAVDGEAGAVVAEAVGRCDAGRGGDAVPGGG